MMTLLEHYCDGGINKLFQFEMQKRNLICAIILKGYDICIHYSTVQTTHTFPPEPNMVMVKNINDYLSNSIKQSKVMYQEKSNVN